MFEGNLREILRLLQWGTLLAANLLAVCERVLTLPVLLIAMLGVFALTAQLLLSLSHRRASTPGSTMPVESGRTPICTSSSAMSSASMPS